MPTPEPGERWGILGGTFDPVHRGHITLAYEIYQKKGLDGVLLIPAYRHPFKDRQAVASYQDRAEMLRLAVSACDRLVVEEIEKNQDLTGYTLDTVRAVKAKFPGVTFYFLVGADNITQIETWHKPEEILGEIHVIAGTRPSFSGATDVNSFVSRIEYIETTPIDVSSSGIRAALAGGEAPEILKRGLDPEVEKYIRARKLYI